VLSIFWKRFNTAGAVAGLAVGLIASIALIIISPSVMGIDDPAKVAASARHIIQHDWIFPLKNPGIISIPLGFIAAIIGTLITREPQTAARFTELTVRANTGLGAEKATAH
jgi:cation/acetate symporter